VVASFYISHYGVCECDQPTLTVIRLYRVEFDFTATDTVELSVSKGEIVIAVDDGGEQDGWVLVHKRNQPSARGYVPAGYLAKTNELALSSGSLSSLPRVNSPRLSSPRLSTVQSTTTTAIPTAPPEGFESAFEQHHTYIRDVLRRREQTFGRLESAIAAQQRRIADLLERNSQLTSRIVELDGRIEEERRRWRDAIETEKKAVQQFGSV